MLRSIRVGFVAIAFVGCATSTPEPAPCPAPPEPSASAAEAPSTPTPTSLRPWLVVAPEASLDAALHVRLEKAFASVERGSGVVVDVDGRLRALFSTLPHHGDAKLAERHLATSHADDCGSVVKPLTAIAALAAGTITTTTQHECDGTFQLGPRLYRCHGKHGLVDLPRAIAISDNVFFFEAAREMKHDDMVVVHRGFGLGEPSEAPPHAATGFVPTTEFHSGDGGQMRVAFTLNQSIGHGMRVTPLQVARAYATLATGTRPTLSLGAASPGTPINPEWAQHLPLIRDAVRGAVTNAEGTAHFAGAVPNVAGKTGTAQSPHRLGEGEASFSTGWFAGWAPADAPRFAFAFRAEGMTGRKLAELVLATLDDLAQ